MNQSVAAVVLYGTFYEVFFPDSVEYCSTFMNKLFILKRHEPHQGC